MIIWMDIAPGRGYHEIMKPCLVGKRTLYIGPKGRVRWLSEDWSEFDVTFTSFYKLDFSLSVFDQVVVENLGIRQERFKGFGRRQSQRFHKVTDFLRDYKGPVLFRPVFGQFYAFQILHEALA